ncbi:type I-E CRISPR-associated protein Cse2/CasB [Streptomyces sp. NPDC015131]|uniref:type I-E CRISPR-associated protein Cse2/CasB n=1 Tax=Streptomyces sp. NPDC015131 TaxID=3364941 RepID=UPI0036FDD949
MSTTSQPSQHPGIPAPGPTNRYWHGRVNEHGEWITDHHHRGSRRPPGEELAALRAGLGRSAFTEPRLWPYYSTFTDGRITDELEAEHAALSLYGLHQQGQSDAMHRRGTSTGKALRALHDRFGEDAVDRRVAAAVSATTVGALVHRLRGLVSQLRVVHQPLDYDQLLLDIQRWHYPEGRLRVRRQWGLAYHLRRPRPDDE